MRLRALLLIAPLLVSCESDDDSLVDEMGDLQLLAVETARSGGTASVKGCDAQENQCANAALGSVGARLIATDSASFAELEARGVVLRLGASSALLGGDEPRLVRGALTIRNPGESSFRLVVGDQVVSLPAGEASEVSLIKRGFGGSVTVTVGRADLAGTALRAGQTAELGTAAASATYRQPSLLPSSEPARVALGAARGLGRMTARVPGTTAVVDGVSLAKHEVSVVVEGGVATTTVIEEFENESNRVLEGTLLFPLPPDASVSRLALWVGDDLVEGEMVERGRAARIFRGIVDDTVRPKDPALLEWSSGNEVTLKIFPIPAKSKRRVLFSYQETLTDLAGEGRYVYPLSAGDGGATKAKDFSIQVELRDETAHQAWASLEGASVSDRPGGTVVRFAQSDFQPQQHFEVRYQRAKVDGALVMQSSALLPEGQSSFLLRARVQPEAQVTGETAASRVILVDRSAGQSPVTLEAQASLVDAILESSPDGGRFAIIACDTACDAFPPTGLSEASPSMQRAAMEFIRGQKLGGASDLAGALDLGLMRLPDVDGAQLVWLTDGVASAGALSAARIANRERGGRDLRILGIGKTIDDLVLSNLADRLGAGYDRVDLGLAKSRLGQEIALGLAQPLVTNLTIELPPGATLVQSAPRAVRVGSELALSGSGFDQTAQLVTLRGQLDNRSFEQQLAVSFQAGAGEVVARQAARRRIAELTQEQDPAREQELIALSQRFFVMSRKTSLLVLENDAMFEAYGIPRTRGKGGEKALVDKETGAGFGGPPVRMGGLLPESTAPENARGVFGDDIGSQFGAGGLGLSGIGEGGGGKGLGLGDIGTIGNGAGFGSGAGRLGGSHASKPPSVRMGATSVSGRLPPEVIQRIVRRNFGRFRLCYERGLQQSADLSGSITVSFVIAADGSVGGASVSASSISDKAMQACVVASFYGLSFPQPEGGTVRVSYPIAFSPAGATPAPLARSSWSGRGVRPATATHQLGDDGWMNAGEADLVKLKKSLADAPMSRRAHESLTRGLLLRGRFAQAHRAAEVFAALDPDSSAAVELLAETTLAVGEPQRAIGVAAGLVERSPRSVSLHRRLAHGYEALGDERRACAHWSSLSELSPTDTKWARQELRCLSRLGQRSDADRRLTELAGILSSEQQKDLSELGAASYEAPAAAFSTVSSKLECKVEASRCPQLVSIDGQGHVRSPVWPSESGESFASLSAGHVRTLLVGGDPDQKVLVEVVARGVSRKVELRRADKQTVALTLP